MADYPDFVNKIIQTLEDHKAREIQILDVRTKANFTDWMVIVTATSLRHGKALANYVMEAAKKSGVQPLGEEGRGNSEWVLVDLGDLVVHIMTEEARAIYQLEKLWSQPPLHRNPNDEA